MSMLRALFVLCLFSAPLLADHAIGDLEGEWYSSIFPKSVRYTFYAVKAETKDRFLFRHTRPVAAGECLGTGIIDLKTGHARSVEICPPRNGREMVFYSVWHLKNEHGELHLNGGYYSEGSSTLQQENLDKDHH